MRKMTRSLGARKAQAGFIQNFIIPGIILIGVVIAGIAMLSSGSSTNTDNEKASMLANVVMAQSLSVTGAIQRAEADGAIGASATGLQDLNASLVAPKYIATGSMPQLPPELGSADWAYTKGDFAVKAAGADIGGAAADDVLRVVVGATDSNVAKAVCLRINNKLYGSSTLATHAPGSLATGGTSDATAGGVEGCATSGTNFVYYKVVNVK